jgi:hypothetical protein
MTQDEKIRQVALEMFKADTAYGSGFYNYDDWLLAYAKLQKLIGYREETSVLGENDSFDDLPDA